MHYLDDLANYPDAIAEETRREVRTKGQGWFQLGEFNRSLDDAFKIWEAVSNHVKSLISLRC